MKRGVKIAIAAAVFALLGVAALYGPCGLLVYALITPHVGLTCEGDDPEAQMARSLSPERFAGIFAAVASLPPWPDLENSDQYEAFLESLELDAIALRRSLPGQVNIRLKGCLDHHLDLVVYGADPPDEEFDFAIAPEDRARLRRGAEPREGSPVDTMSVVVRSLCI